MNKSIALDKLTQNDLQDFYTRLKVSGRLQYEDQQGKGLSDRMVRGCHASCRMALEKAVKEGLITMNPAMRTTPRRNDSRGSSANTSRERTDERHEPVNNYRAETFDLGAVFTWRKNEIRYNRNGRGIRSKPIPKRKPRSNNQSYALCERAWISQRGRNHPVV